MEGRGDVGVMRGYGIHILREGGGRNDRGNGKDQADDDCLELRRNVKQERRVWGRLGKILRREGAYSKVAEMLYKEVLQVVLLFGSETWVLSAEMENGGRDTHQASEKNNGKVATEEGIRGAVYNERGGSAVSGTNSVIKKPYREKTEDGGTVGGAVANI